MRYQYLSFTVSEHIAHARLNRPPVNALNRELVAELTALARDFVHSTDIWVVELSAEGKTFCAGADLKERAAIPEADVATVVRNIQAMAVAWMQVPQPVVVGIQGAALGGGLELALAGDLLVASEEAVLGFPEVGLGIIPAAGGTQRLAQRASMGVAKKWVLTAQQFSAQEALADGVVDAVVPAAAYGKELSAHVERLAANAPLALRQAKAALNASYDEWLKRGLQQELDLYAPLIATRDRHEALEAFAQKRKPVWKGD
jgi:enoyl-CoA hydratase/carnithine racemase